jgi:hypothetical protein
VLPASGDAQSLARAGNQKLQQSKLLDAHGELLDLGASATPSAGDKALATVGTRHRPRGQLKAKRDLLALNADRGGQRRVLLEMSRALNAGMRAQRAQGA